MGNKLVKYSVAETINKMSRNHSLCIVDAEEGCELDYSAAYQAVAGYLRSGSAVVYAAENMPPEETLNNLSKVTNIDPEIYAKNGALTIIKYDALYNKGLDSKNLIKRWQSEIRKKQKKEYKQVLIVDTCKAFTDAGNYHGLLDYEYAKKDALSPLSSSTAAATAAFTSYSYATTTVEWVCCFDSSAINRMPSMPILASILFSHDSKVARAGREEESIVQPLYPGQMRELIRESIDDILGQGTCDLIIKTMKLVYHLEEETVTRRPQLFADTLGKIVGKSAASTVLINALNKMKERTIKDQIITL